jgi:hypothetical protein
MPRRTRLIEALAAVLATSVLLLAAPTAPAAPVADDEREAVDVRRTTLVVRDVDRALTFYRDPLGLKVVYDQEIVRPPRPDDPAKTERRMRLALLRANDDFIELNQLLGTAAGTESR